MLERDHKELLLLDLKVNSTNLERLFSRISHEPSNLFETSAIHPSLKYQFQLEEKIMGYLGVEFSILHRKEHTNILEKTKKLQKRWETKQISDYEYADIVLNYFLSHKSQFDDVIMATIDG